MRKITVILLCAALGLTACRKQMDDGMHEDLHVYISASVEEAAKTRTPYVPSSDPDTDPDSPTDAHPLHAAIWASTDPVKFPDEGNPGDPGAADYKVAYHTSANFRNGSNQLLEGIIYSKGAQWIYFIGMVPKDGWTVTDGGLGASYTFGGSQDVMYADKVHGYYSSGASVNPTLTFHHLLTWLRLEIKAESEEVANTWGRIKDMKIRCNDIVKIDLSQPYNAQWNKTVSFAGSTANPMLPLYRTGTDDPFPGETPYVIPYKNSEEVAYVICESVDASAQSADYIIEIETDHRTASVPVNLKSTAGVDFSQNTMGKQFTLQLTFRPGNNISVGCGVTDWVTGGVSSGVIE